MARLARVIIPGLSYHVTQRGNGGQKVFFSASDYAAYRDRLSEAAREAGVAVWAWCLMPNDVHLVLAPEGEDGLRRALARVHRSTRAWSTRGESAPATSGTGGPAPLRWTNLIWPPHSAIGR